MTSSAAITAGNDASDERELFEPVDDAARRGAATRRAARSRSPPRAAAARRGSRSRSPARSAPRPVRRSASGEPRSAFSVAGDEHADRHAAVDQRIAAARRSARSPACTSIGARPGADTVARDPVHRDTSARRRRPRAAGSVAGSRRVVSIFASSSRHDASSSSTSSARFGTGVLQSLEAALLDRVEPGERLVAVGHGRHGSTPSMSAMRSSCVVDLARDHVEVVGPQPDRDAAAGRRRAASDSPGIGACSSATASATRSTRPERVLRFLDAVLVQRDRFDERLPGSPTRRARPRLRRRASRRTPRARPRPDRTSTATSIASRTLPASRRCSNTAPRSCSKPAENASDGRQRRPCGR